VIVTPIAAPAQHKIARGEFLLALDKGRRLVRRTLGHHEIDEIPIRQAQHAASVSGGDSEVSQCHDQRLGAVTRTQIGRAQSGGANSGSGRGGGFPCPERFVSKDAERVAGCEMALDVEGVEDRGVNRQEALG
jgi:hypothetical protein